MKTPLIASLVLLTATTAHAAITATILNDEGKPLAGARVRAFAREEAGALRKRLLSKEPETPAIAAAISADDGRVSLDVKGEPVVRLVVDADGRAVQLLAATDGRDAGALVLPQAKRQKEHVTSGGRPVGNALVTAGQWYVTHTDAQGNCDVPSLAGGIERLMVIHPDYAIAEVSIGSPDPRRGPAADITLSKGVTIKGRVLAADGKTAVPHALVSVAGWPLAESDENGTYSIAHAPQGWRAILAGAPNLAGVAMNRGAQSVDIKLGPAVSLSGVVKSGTAPVSGAFVSLYCELDPAANLGTVSDSKGRFTFDGLLAGHYVLFGTHPDFNINRLPLVLSASSERVVTAQALVTVLGHVVDEARKPVAGARVIVNLSSIPSGTSVPVPATSSATGEFTTHIYPDSGVQFVVSRRGYAICIVGPFTSEKARNVTITLPAGFPATFRVIDGRRQPVPGVMVEIVRVTEDQGARRAPLPCSETRDDCRTTKADGTLAERMAEGTYDLVVSGDEVAPKRVSGQLLTARSSTVTISVERGAEVSGRVIQNDGTPVGGATIAVRGAIYRSGVSAADGTFTLKGLAAGQVSITASTSNTTPQMLSTPVLVTAPSKNVLLRLPTPTSLSGRVAEKTTGQPITDFQVMTSAGDVGASRPSTSSPIHSDDGTFTVQVVPGRTELRVTASGYVRATLGGLTVEEGKPLSGVEVRMDRGARVIGRVTSQGDPVAGVYLTAFADRMANSGSGATTDYNGDYTLDGVDPGDLTLQARKQGWLQKEKGITAKAGEDVHVDLELDHGRELTGRVVDRSGHPVESARILVRGVGGDRSVRANATSDPDGTFKLSGLAEGHLTLVTEHQGYVTATTDDVDPAQNVTVTLDRGGAVTGRVAGLSQAEIGNVVVMASYGSGSGQANVDSEGSFTVRGIPDGTVSVSAMRTGPQMRRSAPKSVTVTNGSAPPVEIDFAEGIAVSGRVTREGKPVTGGGSISFSGTKGEPGGGTPLAPDGTYQINGLQAGDYRVFVSLYGNSGTSTLPNVTVAGSMTQDFDLTGRMLRGRVVDASTSTPLSDVMVQLRPLSPGIGITRQAGTDSDGRFSMDLLDDGQYHLITQRSQYAALQQNVNIPSQDLELRLDGTTPTTVHVIDATTGQSMTAEVTVTDPSAKTPVAFTRATADVDAKLFLAEGHYTMTVGAAGYVNSSVDLVVPSPIVQVTLQPGGTINFRFHGSETSYRVRLLVNGQEYRTYWINSIHRTSVNGVAPGAYTVEVTSANLKTPHGNYPVSLQAGQTVSVDVLN